MKRTRLAPLPVPTGPRPARSAAAAHVPAMVASWARRASPGVIHPSVDGDEGRPAADPLSSRKFYMDLLRSIAAIVFVGLVCMGFTTFEGGSESTDDAYVQGNVVQVTPQIAGTVVAIEADDTDFVRAGQPLVRIDPVDARVELMQAESQLAQTVREVRALFAANATLKSQVALREAEVARAGTDLARAQDDVARRHALVDIGAVGREEFDHATAQLQSARDAVLSTRSAADAARGQLTTNESLTDDTTVENHPNVERTAAHVRAAWLTLRRCILPAPVDGYVARRSVQVGQHVQAGSPLMTIVPLDTLWVDANFKEGQLSRLRIGQPARLVADVYGSQLEYHGIVAGLGAGTGAAFALLPAQNATGNWVKVVQRVPVRIQLKRDEVAWHPLRLGLSMRVSVDVRDESGHVLTDAIKQGPVRVTTVFDGDDARLETTLREIIARNAGHPAVRGVPHVAAVTP
jgi:membrane fusion protein (multidrug efflux system)